MARGNAAGNPLGTLHGEVTLSLVVDADGTPAPEPVHWTISEDWLDLDGKRPVAAQARGQKSTFRLTAGSYVALGRTPAASIEHHIDVEAGRHFVYAILLG